MLTRYERPSSSKLAGLKHGIYHPRLPTLRRMNMDDVTHRLPVEHSRTTTTCTRDAFAAIRSSSFPQEKKPLHCKAVLNKQTETAVRTYQPFSRPMKYTKEWKNILKTLDSQTPPLDLTVTGLEMRRKHPSITSSWQHSVYPRDRSRPTTPKPMPAMMYSRYRSTGMRPCSPNPWR